MGSQRRVVVVGAGSGIEAATATHCHARGDFVVAIDVRPHSTPASRSLQCDLRNATEIKHILEDLEEGWDLLASVAGVPGTLPAHDVLLVNYLGMRLMTEGLLPLMQRGGSVVAVASTAGLGWDQRVDVLEGLLATSNVDDVKRWQDSQDPSYPVYSTSKQALILYSKRLARTAWTRYGVRVNTVSPGPVETPILADLESSMGKEVLDAVRDTVGRHGTVDDVVPLIDFLGTPEARWINGQDIQVDGGFISSMVAGPPVELSHTTP